MPAKDIEKRKRVMRRSIKLGHCVCDPKKPCPCPMLLEQDVCTCAGEKPEVKKGPIRLTQLLANPGCASKVDQASLKKILGGLPASIDDPRVLVGVPAGDDAGIYKLRDDLALVQTVDVFTPSVDDPYIFGQIAATNSLSDVYAMGGTPVSALSVLGFPIRELDENIMREILRGGIDKMNEAGVPIVGGHSINDREIKAGFAVTGTINPERIMTNSHAQPGDCLVLTKPIGTGMIAFSEQIDRAPQGSVQAIAESMTTLNGTASELMLSFEAHACTDVTGFGLMGHLGEMARSSGVDVEVVWDHIPVFPGVLYCLANQIIPGGVERNRESSAHYAVLEDGVAPLMLELCFDPQTSGGLLVSLPEKQAVEYVRKLHEAGLSNAAIVGKVKGEGGGKVHVVTDGTRTLPEPDKDNQKQKTSNNQIDERPEEVIMTEKHNEEECCAPEPEGAECCAPGNAATRDGTASGSQAVLKSFVGFMQKTNAPGALDVTTKEAVAVALSILARCGPCAKSHIKKAKSMGFTQEEIDELANQAISFGGCSVMMFYKELGA